MVHLGSITEIDGTKIEPVDCITGGSPCQDLSIAGKRAGLAGERSGLFMEQIRLFKEMREHDKSNGRTDEHIRPRWMVWENVTGVFSNNGGKDFQAVLTELIRTVEPTAPDVPMPSKNKWPHAGELHDEMGKWSVAYRTHDAQFWGTPQRRRRISVLLDAGGVLAGKVLFDEHFGEESEPEIQSVSESLSGHIEQSRTQGKTVAGAVGESLAETGEGGLTYDVRISSDGTKNWRAHAYKTEISRALDTGGENPDSNHGGVCVVPGETVYSLNGKDVAPPLDAHYYLGAGARGGVEREAVLTYGISSYDSNAMKSPNPHSGFYEADTARTLDNNGGSPACNQGGVAVVYDARGNGDGKTVPTITGDHENRITDYTAVCIGNGQLDQLKESEKVGALNCMDDQQAVITYSIGNRQVHDAMTPSKDVSKTLNCLDDPAKILACGLDSSTYNQDACVRRLTPLECTRLQSFPDGWVDIGEWKDSKGKIHKDADAPKYKALGNSIALPFWYFLLKKISATYDEGYTPTLGSLFDGIGGFPICWEQINGKGTARWASEIEEFCIALTKLRFSEE